MLLVLWVFSAAAQDKKTNQAAEKSKSSTDQQFKASMARGKVVYNTYCLTCHQADGGGVPRLNAPLIKSSSVLGDKSKLINIILNGMQGVEIDGEFYSNSMPPADYLTDQQIADVLTFIRNSFGNKAGAVNLSE